MSFTNNQIIELDLEISAFCNAECMDCTRMWLGEKDISYNPHIDHWNQIISIDELKEHIGQFESLDNLSFCGNKGDPMGHPNIADLIKWCQIRFDDPNLLIETNGSLGSVNTWIELAKTNVEVNFGLDGLEDTNHIYRRKVDWTKIMRNAKVFIEHGGHANWNAIDFPHIKHQIAKMQEMSVAMGFKKFTVKKRFNPDLDPYIVEYKNTEVVPIDIEQAQKKSFPSVATNCIIEPKCAGKNGNALYYENAKVYPCCVFGQSLYREDKTLEKEYKELDRLYGANWNSLRHHSLDQILAGDFYANDLEASWKKNSFTVCKEKCGACLG